MIERTIIDRVINVEPDSTVDIKSAVSRNKRVPRNVEVIGADRVSKPSFGEKTQIRFNVHNGRTYFIDLGR